MDFITPDYRPHYPETDVIPLPYCEQCGTLVDFGDAACNCDLF